MDKIQQHAQAIPDLKAGVGLVLAGSGGSFAQAITEWSNLVVAVGNSFLVVGGLFLMYYKIKAMRREKRQTEKGE